MNYMKQKASELVYDLYNRDILTFKDYAVLDEVINGVEPLRDRDEYLEELWAELEDVPMDPETERIEQEFFGWPTGTKREEIWHWFDKRHSKGIAYLLYGGTEDYVPEVRRLYSLKVICSECESTDCAFNCGGICRFPMVHERTAQITEKDGCLEYVIGSERKGIDEK